VLHKYRGRVLLVATGACAVHCRYCFRQAFPYASEHVGSRQWQAALDYIARDGSIEEVILSGGDPLMLPTRRLKSLTDALAQIGHLRRLRIHTRLPVILPDRVTDALVAWIESLPWPAIVVIHANHAGEFDPAVDHALARLRASGAHLLNQAVLLQGVNDSAQALAELMRRAFDAGALPYYLHLLDPVSGAQRFDTDDSRATAIVDDLRRELSGYLVPRLVREVAGEPYKLPVL
jgi:EF-P beta-lysylation protein EpmB